MSKNQVSFNSEGSEVVADLYMPQDRSDVPIVVLAGGWCYVKELVQPAYAEALVDRGIGALVFDYRCLGDSEGDPRQHLDPFMQITDYRNAISYVEQLDVVDPARIGVWGISYSGGHALIVGGIDPRVRAVVSIVPVVDGLPTMQRAHGTMGFRRLASAVLDARRERFRTGEHTYIKHSSEHPDEELCTWPFPGSPPLFQWLKETQAPNYENRNTVASVEKLMEYSVWPHIERLVNTPTMMLVAEGDDFTMWDLEIRAYNSVPTPEKSLVVAEGISHHDLYRNPEDLAFATAHTADWFERYL